MSETENNGPISAQDEQAYLNELRGYRHDLLAIQKEQITSYDKAILSMSAGALGISIAFSDKFGGDDPVVTWALLASWAAFCVAITINVLSYLFSSYDMEIELEKVRRSIQSGGTEIVSGNWWRKATQWANCVSLIAFLTGVGLFGLHAHTTTHMTTTLEVIENAGKKEPGKKDAIK